MEIVVNEWLLHYLCPDAEQDNANLAVEFITAWVQKCDKVVIRRQSPFTKKFYRFLKASESNIPFNKRFLRLYKLLFRNLDKTIVVDEADINNLPSDVEAKAPPKDKYLVELAYSKSGRIIVTTDTTLKDKFQDESDIKIYLLEEFSQDYLAQTKK